MTLSPLSASELQAIKERAERATQGPWDDEGGYRVRSPEGACIVEVKHLDGTAADNAFIAGSRQDIPRLLETVAYWQEEAERLRKALDWRMSWKT